MSLDLVAIMSSFEPAAFAPKPDLQSYSFTHPETPYKIDLTHEYYPRYTRVLTVSGPDHFKKVYLTPIQMNQTLDLDSRRKFLYRLVRYVDKYGLLTGLTSDQEAKLKEDRLRKEQQRQQVNLSLQKDTIEALFSRGRGY